MMWLKIVILGILLFGCSGIISKSESECEKLNKAFIEANTFFLACVLNNNQRSTYCLNCTDEYSRLLSKYHELLTGTEDKNGQHITCRSQFIDGNQLKLVDTILANSKHLWEIGICTDCLDSTCNLSVHPPENCTASNHTQEFEKHYSETQDCFQQFPAPLACINCSSKYEAMNNMYNTIRFRTSDKFCSTIKFWMNETRYKWSTPLPLDGFGCCKDRNPSMEDFSLISALSLTLSLTFYVVTFIMGKRGENQLQHIPDDLMPPRNRDETDDAIMNINEEEPSTSDPPAAAIQNNSSNILNASDDSSSSNDEDDDPLPLHNQNLIQI